MPKASKSREQWNDKVKAKVEVLDPLKEWLNDIVKSETDWGTQKSAHQAMRFLELAQYEMWNMQYWKNSRQVKLHEDAEKETI
jgi:hypothetical protein